MSGREPLDAAAIRRALSGAGQDNGIDIDINVVDEVDSTNAALWRSAPATPVQRPCVRVLFAEHQSAGRGRRGRRWLSAAGDSLCFSLRWWSPLPLSAQGPLPLVAGLAAAEALRALGAAVAVKWPNDLVCATGKLGGILVEVRAEDEGSAAVIGIGLNLRVTDGLVHALAGPVDDTLGDTQEMPAQPPAALAALLPELPPRNTVAARVLGALLQRLDDFAAHGWPAMAPAWEAVDALAGRRVRVRDARGERSGEVLGLAGDGALRVRFDDGEATLHGGEVSLRA